MDKFGQQRCLECLYMVAPWLDEGTIVTLDGDVKGDIGVGRMGDEFDRLDGKEPTGTHLIFGDRYTHIMKNLMKYMDSKLPSVTFICTSYLKGSSDAYIPPQVVLSDVRYRALKRLNAGRLEVVAIEAFEADV